jgi:RNA polymerase sigma-70 factor, ECF subfamily
VTDPYVLSSKKGSETSLGLLERARQRAPGAWDQMVSLYTPLVYCTCRRAGLGAADTEDVGQEVFLAVARKLVDFRRERPGDSFRGWLRTITTRKIRDHWRKHPPALAAAGGSDALQRLGQLAESSGAPADDSGSSDGEETRTLLRQALRLLEPQFKGPTWQAFWRVCVAGRSPAEVAKELGMTLNAVYLAKSHVLHRFREEFADLVDAGLDSPRPADVRREEVPVREGP